MPSEVRSRVNELCEALTSRATEAGKQECWFEPKAGPNYIKVLVHEGPRGTRTTDPAVFCFVAKEDAPFEWSNYRSGDVMAPKTFRQPWKMDTGAVANVFELDGGVSYWVVRYGRDLGLW